MIVISMGLGFSVLKTVIACKSIMKYDRYNWFEIEIYNCLTENQILKIGEGDLALKVSEFERNNLFFFSKKQTNQSNLNLNINIYYFLEFVDESDSNWHASSCTSQR